MAKKALLTVGGTHHKVGKGLITIGGVHRKIKKALITVNGVWKLCWSEILDVVFKFTTTGDVAGQYDVIERFAGVNANGKWELLMTCTCLGAGDQYGRYSQVMIKLSEHIGKTLSFRYDTTTKYLTDATRAIWFRDENDEAFKKIYLDNDDGEDVSFVIPEGTDDCRIYVWTYPSTGETLTSHMVLSNICIDGKPIM